MKQPARDDPGDQRAPRGADRGQRDRRSEHGPERAKPGGEAALEQDQHKRDRSHQFGERVVREVDPAEPVGAHGHPQSEEQDQRRQAQARGHRRGDHAGRQQGSAGEDELRVGDHARDDAMYALRLTEAGVPVRACSCMNKHDRVVCLEC